MNSTKISSPNTTVRKTLPVDTSIEYNALELTTRKYKPHDALKTVSAFCTERGGPVLKTRNWATSMCDDMVVCLGGSLMTLPEYNHFCARLLEVEINARRTKR